MLSSSGADVKWVEPENFHYNLKFFGELDDSLVQRVIQILSSKKFKRFNIHIKGLGAFPSEAYIRVVWLGMSNGSEQIMEIQSNLEEEFSKIGIEREEREFVPHLTLGRIRSLKDIEKLKELIARNKDFDAGGFDVGSIKLFESKLSPKGPKYYSLHDQALV